MGSRLMSDSNALNRIVDMDLIFFSFSATKVIFRGGDLQIFMLFLSTPPHFLPTSEIFSIFSDLRHLKITFQRIELSNPQEIFQISVMDANKNAPSFSNEALKTCNTLLIVNEKRSVTYNLRSHILHL